METTLVILLFIFKLAVRGEEDDRFNALLAVIDDVEAKRVINLTTSSVDDHLRLLLREAPGRRSAVTISGGDDDQVKGWSAANMHYCEPIGCNGYNRRACGINRATMRFKWFQSLCHLFLYNACSKVRGDYKKFNAISARHCVKYTVEFRAKCHNNCDDRLDPVCGVSTRDNHVALFRNKCAFEAAICRQESFNEYELSKMAVCRATYSALLTASFYNKNNTVSTST